MPSFIQSDFPTRVGYDAWVSTRARSPWDRDISPPTRHPKKAGRVLFKNPYGEGDIVAAGVLPVINDLVLLGEEDIRAPPWMIKSGCCQLKEWTPALSLLGGKIDEGEYTHGRVRGLASLCFPYKHCSIT